MSGNVNGFMKEVDDLIGLSLKGIPQEVIKEQAKQYAGLESHYVYKKILKRINFHKSKKHKLFLLSASLHELVEKIGEILDFEESVGTKLQVRRGVYTGVVKKPSMIGKDRLKIVKRLAKKHNINLKKSYAYGNCVNDLHVLEAVGNPVAVNPNAFLKPIAKKKGWKII
jgi:HAD superfamily hydrolase (TIGR01490 family)